MTRHFKIKGMDSADEVAVLISDLGPMVGDEKFKSFDVYPGEWLPWPG